VIWQSPTRSGYCCEINIGARNFTDVHQKTCKNDRRRPLKNELKVKKDVRMLKQWMKKAAREKKAAQQGNTKNK